MDPKAESQSPESAQFELRGVGVPLVIFGLYKKARPTSSST